VSTDWDGQRIARAALVGAVVIVTVWMLWRFLPALAWAGVLATATWPLRLSLVRHGMGKTTVAALLTIVLAVALILPLIELGIQAAREGQAIAEWVRDIRQNGLGTPEWLSNLPYVGHALAAWWVANLAEPDAARALFTGAERTGLFAVTRMLGIEVASRLTVLVFTLLTLFFVYRNGQDVAEDAHVAADRLFGPTGERLAQNVVATIRGTVNGLVLVGLAEGVLLGIAYAIVGLPHAAPLGLATAILAIVPFGAPLVFAICSVVLLAQSQMTAAVGLLVFGSVLVFVADHFVRPILIGSSTRVPFLWILLGIFGGLETFGLIGLFLGPAIISVVIAIWRESVA